MIGCMNRRGLLAALALLLAGGSALAGNAKYRVNLLAGERRDGAWLAGLEIDMEEGWKTYWRVPGDAGIPPSFDWSRSLNVKTVEMRWPAPRRYHDAAGETIGYKTRVVFPLTVIPDDPAKPVRLALDGFFAVCKDICIPAKASLAVELASDAAAASLISAFDALVPVRGRAFESAEIVTAGDKPALRLAGEARADLDDADIFVEGFDAAYFRAPRPVAGGYVLAIDGLKDAARLKGKTLKLTLVADHIRLEQDIAVD